MGFFFNSGFFEMGFMLVFLRVIGMFIVTAVRGISQWNKNKLLCYLSGGERRQNGIPCKWLRIWDAGGGRYGKIKFPGNKISWI